jgi:hypothetical protein
MGKLLTGDGARVAHCRWLACTDAAPTLTNTGHYVAKLFPSPLPRRRALGLVLLVAAAALGVHPVAPAQAAPTATKTCTGPEGGSTASVGDTVTCTLVLAGADTDLPAGATITVAVVGGNYRFVTATCTVTSGTGSCVALGTVGATGFAVQCLGAACPQLTVTESLAITAGSPSTISQQVSISTPAATLTVSASAFRIVPAGTTFFVSPTGSDANSCQSRTSPCLTVNRAHEVARDGDTILLLPGEHTVTITIRLSKLVSVQPDANGKVVLKVDKAANDKTTDGLAIFEVTAQGGPNLHAAIRNLTLGGNLRPGGTAPAIRLLGDSYTEVAANIIGAEDLPVGNGIVLAASDHPNLHDNTIQGSSRFVFQPLLVVGKTVTGFGIVTVECFGQGGPTVSNSVTITNNLFTNLLIAGVWLCSDGAGEHAISTNTFRGTWRGIALKDVTDTAVSANTVIAGRDDGIIVYGASLHNLVERNRVESHVSPTAAGIRVGWAADPILPLDTRVEGNELVRVTVGIHVFGARTTRIRGNAIKVAGARTGVLLTPADTLGDPGSQPRDTEVTGNLIVFTGGCAPVVGCGLRLLGVTVPVRATDNDWGLVRPGDVEDIIWHQHDDEKLGVVTYIPFRNMVLEPSPTPRATPPASTAGAPPLPAPPLVATPAAGAGAAAAPVTVVTLAAGCTAQPWPGADGVSVIDAVLGISPEGAQRTATVWRRTSDGWQAWTPQADGPREAFTLRRGEQLLVCVGQAATWTIPTIVGGP